MTKKLVPIRFEAVLTTGLGVSKDEKRIIPGRYAAAGRGELDAERGGQYGR